MNELVSRGYEWQNREGLKRARALTYLVVDHCKHHRQPMIFALHSFGCKQVEWAVSAPEAMARLAKGGIDVVLARYDLVGVDGVDLSRLIRRGKVVENDSIPIILYGNHREPHLITKIHDAGADEYILTPVAAAVILDRLLPHVAEERRFVRNDGYAGPERRTHVFMEYPGPDRRTY